MQQNRMIHEECMINAPKSHDGNAPNTKVALPVPIATPITGAGAGAGSTVVACGVRAGWGAWDQFTKIEQTSSLHSAVVD